MYMRTISITLTFVKSELQGENRTENKWLFSFWKIRETIFGGRTYVEASETFKRELCSMQLYMYYQ